MIFQNVKTSIFYVSMYELGNVLGSEMSAGYLKSKEAF